MKIPLIYGLLMAIVGALLTFGLYFGGFHDTPEKLQMIRWPSAGVGVIAAIGLVVLSVRARRAEYPANREWGYGSAFGTGVVTGLWACLFSAVFSFVYFAMINPQFSDVVYQLQAQTMEAKGVPADVIARQEGIMRKVMSPVGLTIVQTVQAIFGSVIFSLVIAIFLRKPLPVRESVTTEASPPPVG